MEFNKIPYNETEAKETAKAILAATDYAMMPDVSITNRAEFEAYRAYLRAVMKNPVIPMNFNDIPQPIWVESETV